MISKETNRCLNFIKGIAIILIVILHGELPTYIGSIINMFARWGVPAFFMTSGYFLYKEEEKVNGKSNGCSVKLQFFGR